MRFRADVDLRALRLQLVALDVRIPTSVRPGAEVPRRWEAGVVRAVNAVFDDWSDALELGAGDCPTELELLANDAEHALQARDLDEEAKALRAIAREVLHRLEVLADSDHPWGTASWTELEQLREVAPPFEWKPWKPSWDGGEVLAATRGNPVGQVSVSYDAERGVAEWSGQWDHRGAEESSGSGEVCVVLGGDASGRTESVRRAKAQAEAFLVTAMQPLQDPSEAPDADEDADA